MNAPEMLDVVVHEDAEADGTEHSGRRGVGFWALLLALVIVFGYLTASRRAALGTLIEQVADIVRDFRGYDPEF